MSPIDTLCLIALIKINHAALSFKSLSAKIVTSAEHVLLLQLLIVYLKCVLIFEIINRNNRQELFDSYVKKCHYGNKVLGNMALTYNRETQNPYHYS